MGEILETLLGIVVATTVFTTVFVWRRRYEMRLQEEERRFYDEYYEPTEFKRLTDAESFELYRRAPGRSRVAAQVREMKSRGEIDRALGIRVQPLRNTDAWREDPPGQPGVLAQSARARPESEIGG